MRRDKIILGSSSAIRRKLLTELVGRQFGVEVVSPNIHERQLGDRSSASKAEELVSLLATEKSKAIMNKISSTHTCTTGKEDDGEEESRASLLVTADSVATWKGNILEKPNHLEQAKEFLQGYADGSPVSIVTGVCVTNINSGKQQVGVDSSSVRFSPFSPEAIEELLQEGLLLKCAGGIIIEHEIFKRFTSEIIGTIDGIQGLPKEMTLRLIEDASKADYE